MRNGLTKKRTILCLKIVTTGLIFWMLARYSQLQMELINTLFANFFFSFVIIGFCFLTVLVNAWRWYRLSSVPYIQLPLYHTFLASYLGMAFNNVLPGSVGGDFFRLFYMMKKFPQQKTAALFSILLDRICGLMGIFTMASVIAAFYLTHINSQQSFFYILMSCFCVGVSGISIFFVSIFFLPSLGFLNHWVVKLRSKWTVPIRAFFTGMHSYKEAKWIIVESVGISIISQFILLSCVLLINKMMGLAPLSWFDFMLALAMGQIANLIPLTPGGLGVGEATFANIIYLLHPGATAAYATVFFALRILSTLAYLPGVVLGIFSTHLFKKSIIEKKSSV